MTSTNDSGPDRRRLGSMGEEAACRFLARRGLVIVARNVLVGSGEIDVVARHGAVPVAVEVRSRWLAEPLDSFDHRKQRQVDALARLLGPPTPRVDLVTVRFHPHGADLRWVPGIA